eukprot:GHVU01186314.1.p1 GENE.GHVU01186314.1~~GHVU01186314.1.p1  ORF type:complete len:525 (+),score=122.00 GHVU01186314.1:1191-2765(+)
MSAVHPRTRPLLPTSASCAAAAAAAAETHILCPTHIPGNYLTLRGLGVEVHGSRVSTSFGFKELRTCQILREESFYESGSQFKVLLVDRPLQGIYTGGGNKETDGSESVVRRECMSLAEAADFIVNRWLHDGPQVQTAIQRAIDDFQETHIPIPDFETETAVAIGGVAAFVGDCVCRHRNLANSGGGGGASAAGGGRGVVAGGLLHTAASFSSSSAAATGIASAASDPHAADKRALIHEAAERYVYGRLHTYLWSFCVSLSRTNDFALREKALRHRRALLYHPGSSSSDTAAAAAAAVGGGGGWGHHPPSAPPPPPYAGSSSTGGDGHQSAAAAAAVMLLHGEYVYSPAVGKLLELETLETPQEKLYCLKQLVHLLPTANSGGGSTGFPNNNTSTSGEGASPSSSSWQSASAGGGAGLAGRKSGLQALTGDDVLASMVGAVVDVFTATAATRERPPCLAAHAVHVHMWLQAKPSCWKLQQEAYVASSFRAALVFILNYTATGLAAATDPILPVPPPGSLSRRRE